MITLTREEAQQVLDALGKVFDHNDWQSYETTVELLRARLAQPEPEQLGEIMPADEEQLKRIAKLVQPEPEPVAYAKPDDLVNDGYGHVFTVWSSEPATIDTTPLYTSPPQREWQGLTDEEIDEMHDTIIEDLPQAIAFARAVEAKLKEKNT